MDIKQTGDEKMKTKFLILIDAVAKPYSVILSPSAVILNPSLVILNAVKNLVVSLRACSVKNLILRRDTRPFMEQGPALAGFRVTLLSLATVSIFILFLTCPVFSKNIAVIPFQNITGDKDKNWISAGFAETLTTKLVKAKEITVLEREQMSKILEEIKFQKSGLVDVKEM